MTDPELYLGVSKNKGTKNIQEWMDFESKQVQLIRVLAGEIRATPEPRKDPAENTDY